MLDPTAGGGSIPFESSRLGITTLANDLNPVGALIMAATNDEAFGSSPRPHAHRFANGHRRPL